MWYKFNGDGLCPDMGFLLKLVSVLFICSVVVSGLWNWIVLLKTTIIRKCSSITWTGRNLFQVGNTSSKH